MKGTILDNSIANKRKLDSAGWKRVSMWRSTKLESAIGLNMNDKTILTCVTLRHKPNF